MTTNRLGSPPRDAWVMPKTLGCSANVGAEPHGYYGMVSKAALWLSRFRLSKPFSFAHSGQESLRRDAPVMPRSGAPRKEHEDTR